MLHTTLPTSHSAVHSTDLANSLCLFIPHQLPNNKQVQAIYHHPYFPRCLQHAHVCCKLSEDIWLWFPVYHGSGIWEHEHVQHMEIKLGGICDEDHGVMLGCMDGQI